MVSGWIWSLHQHRRITLPYTDHFLRALATCYTCHGLKYELVLSYVLWHAHHCDDLLRCKG